MNQTGKKEGIRITGIPSKDELEASPGYPEPGDLARGPIAVIECVQDIPCNPCETACQKEAIKVGNPITRLPVFYPEKCDGCGNCIPGCPGQAIFRVDMTYDKDKATVSFPYEYIPLPNKGDMVQGVDRAGKTVCKARVLRVRKPGKFEGTTVITVVVPGEFAMEVRSMERLKRKG